MKAHHEKMHAKQVVKAFNNAVATIEICRGLLEDEIDGTPIDKPLEELVSMIKENCQSVESGFSGIVTFFGGFDVYDLTQHTNKSRQQVLTDKITSDTLTGDLKIAVDSPQVKDKTKLAQIASTITNPLEYATPLTLETSYQYAAILNNWLDASSYVLRGISETTGEPHGWPIDKIKTFVTGCLNQFGNISPYIHVKELEPEVTEMTSIRNYVLSHLDDTDFIVLADYIDAGYPKLPLMRRLWAIG